MNDTAASLLGFLHDGPMTGSQLLQLALQRIGNFWSLTRSQVYSELDRLATAGYVEAGSRGPRRSRTFSLTSSGREAFSRWLQSGLKPEQIRFPMLLALSFAQHIKAGQLHAMLAGQRELHARRLQAYEQQQAEFLRAQVASERLIPLSFGISYEQMTVAWIDRTIAQLPADGAQL